MSEPKKCLQLSVHVHELSPFLNLSLHHKIYVTKLFLSGGWFSWLLVYKLLQGVQCNWVLGST